MDSDDITCAQAARIRTHTGPVLGYLLRLRERMDHRGFWNQDPFYKKVADACEAMHSLNVELHYMSVPRGVGRPERKKE